MFTSEEYLLLDRILWHRSQKLEGYLETADNEPAKAAWRIEIAANKALRQKIRHMSGGIHETASTLPRTGDVPLPGLQVQSRG